MPLLPRGGRRRVAMMATASTTRWRWVCADTGMAMGTGTDAAIEAGDITLVRGDLRTVPIACGCRLTRCGSSSRTCSGRSGYNVAAIPLAAVGLLRPMIAGAAMALSSVLVVTNSLRLKRFR